MVQSTTHMLSAFEIKIVHEARIVERWSRSPGHILFNLTHILLYSSGIHASIRPSEYYNPKRHNLLSLLPCSNALLAHALPEPQRPLNPQHNLQNRPPPTLNSIHRLLQQPL